MDNIGILASKKIFASKGTLFGWDVAGSRPFLEMYGDRYIDLRNKFRTQSDFIVNSHNGLYIQSSGDSSSYFIPQITGFNEYSGNHNLRAMQSALELMGYLLTFNIMNRLQHARLGIYFVVYSCLENDSFTIPPLDENGYFDPGMITNTIYNEFCPILGGKEPHPPKNGILADYDSVFSIDPKFEIFKEFNENNYRKDYPDNRDKFTLPKRPMFYLLIQDMPRLTSG